MHLQIFRKQAKFTYSQLFYFKMHVTCGIVFVFLVFVTPPTANLPNSISAPGVASWRKTQCIAAMEVNKELGQRSHPAGTQRHKTLIFS